MRDGIYQVNKNRRKNVVKTPLSNVSKQYQSLSSIFRTIKDTHKEKAPSNKTQALKKSANMGVLVVGTLTSIKLFITSS